MEQEHQKHTSAHDEMSHEAMMEHHAHKMHPKHKSHPMNRHLVAGTENVRHGMGSGEVMHKKMETESDHG